MRAWIAAACLLASLLASLLACGARSELDAVGGDGGDGAGASGAGGGAGGVTGSCEHEVSWGDVLGDAEDLESADGLAVSARCVTYIAGDLSQSLFLRGYDDSGAVWVDERWGDGEGELIRGVAVDANDNIALAAQVWGSIDFGGGPLSSVENWDIVLVSLAPDGTHRWSQRFGGAGYQEAADVVVTQSGDIYLSGEISGPVDFAGALLTPAGSWDAVLARVGSDGIVHTARLFGDEDIQLGPALAATDDGVIAGGFFSGTIDFGVTSITGAGDDGYVAWFDDSLTLASLLHVRGEGTQRVEDVAAVLEGAVAVGYFHREITVDDTTRPAVGDRDAFVLRSRGDGTLAWILTFGGQDGEATAESVSVGPDGAIWVAGRFRGPLDIGGQIVSAEDAHFVLRTDADGNSTDAYILGGAVRAGTHIAAMPNGGYALAGALLMPFSVGDEILTPAGGSDAFVARVRP